MTRPRLLVRLLWSHVAIALGLSVIAAASIFGLIYVIEDESYEALVTAALRDPDPLVEVWEWSDAPEDVRAALGDRERLEIELDGREYHLAVSTDADGVRRVARVEAREVERDRQVVLLLAGAVLAASLGALLVGYRVARKSLMPIEDLADRLRDPAGLDTAQLRELAGDDEVGVLARRLADAIEGHERAVESEVEFVRNASHELRNPLSVLHGAVDLLRRTQVEDPEAFGARLDRMERSVSRMQRTVDELLRLARQESAVANVDPEGFRRQLAELIEDERRQLGVEVQLLVEQSGEPDGSLGLWLIVLRNLIDNAVNATREGKIEVIIDATRVSVRDSGPGFDPESARTGFGLAIVRRCVDRIGWTLAIDSDGSGTRILVEPESDAPS